MEPKGNLLADRRFRSLVGLTGGIVIAVVSFLFLEGIAQWIGYGIAILDVVLTPYLLGKAAEADRS